MLMDYKTLIDDFKIPVIGLGTLGIGGFMETDSSKDEESIQAIKDAIELGFSKKLRSILKIKLLPIKFLTTLLQEILILIVTLVV